MPVTRLNHAVLYVRDVNVSKQFYGRLLGFRVVHEMAGRAVFLQAPASTNDHDLGLFAMGAGAAASPAGRSTVGLYHLAWEVDTLEELDRIGRALGDAGALVGATDHGTTMALYAKDPDDIEFEVSWIVPADRLDGATMTGRPLDLAAAKQRFGATTPGGIGVSVPVGVSAPSDAR